MKQETKNFPNGYIFVVKKKIIGRNRKSRSGSQILKNEKAVRFDFRNTESSGVVGYQEAMSNMQLKLILITHFGLK